MTQEIKDKLVFALIYGGVKVVKGILISVLQSAGIISPGFANGLRASTRDWTKEFCDNLWQSYIRTGYLCDEDEQMIYQSQEMSSSNNESSDNIITLDMEDGTQKDYLVLDTIECEGKQYIALTELDSNEYDILAMTVADDTVKFNVIEDDDEFNAIAAMFEQLFSQYEERT